MPAETALKHSTHNAYFILLLFIDKLLKQNRNSEHVGNDPHHPAQLSLQEMISSAHNWLCCKDKLLQMWQNRTAADVVHRQGKFI